MTRAASRGQATPFSLRSVAHETLKRWYCPNPTSHREYLTENRRVGSAILLAASIKTRNKNIERAGWFVATTAFRHVRNDRFCVPITRLAPRTSA